MSFQETKFLVVDDSMIARRMLIMQLKDLGFSSVEEAENGLVGLQKLDTSFRDHQPIQLIITDLQMPVMTGLEMIHRIRSNPEFAQVTILITSVETDKGTVLAAVTNGANGYILKPSSPTVLKDKLDKLLNKNVAS